MKRLFILAIAALMLIPVLGANAAADDGDAMLGTWLTEDGKAKVKVYKCKDKYCGQIIWLKEPKNEDGTDKTDVENPDEKLRSRKLVGLPILWNFSYSGDNTWEDGRIYAADDGKTYKCKITLEGNKLNVRGYVGISAFGRTTVWTSSN